MPYCFRSQTDVTISDVALHVVEERLPVVFSGDELNVFFDAKVAYQRIVVMATDQLRSLMSGT